MKLRILALSLLAISCASKHPGNMGASLSDKKSIDITVSGKTSEGKYDSAFQLIEVTVENNTAEWVRIDRVEVVIEDPSKSKISAVVGADLDSWVEAKNSQDALDNHNAEMAALGVAAAGTAVAVAGAKNKNANATKGGLIALYGTTGYMAGRDLSKAKSNVESAQKVPSTHLYHPFSVPGKMFMRKWILMNKPVGVVIDNLVLEFETVEGKKERYAIKI